MIDGRHIDAFSAHHPSQVNPQWIGYTPKVITAPQPYTDYVIGGRYQLLNKKTVLLSLQLWITVVGLAGGQSIGISLPHRLEEISVSTPQGFALGSMPAWSFYGVTTNAGVIAQGTGCNGYIASNALNGYAQVALDRLNTAVGFSQDNTQYVINGFYGIK